MAARSASGPYQFANLHDSRMCPVRRYVRTGVCGERLVLLYFALQGDDGAFMEEEKKIKFPTTGTYDFPKLILGGKG